VLEAWRAEGAAMCSVNLGEVLYTESRRLGRENAERIVEQARGELEVVDPDWGLVADAAAAKLRGRMSYADAFCVATAQRLASPVWTGDPEILALAGELDVVDLRAARPA
jgi:predicted nucleic acid-binding protein